MLDGHGTMKHVEEEEENSRSAPEGGLAEAKLKEPTTQQATPAEHCRGSRRQQQLGEGRGSSS